MPRLGFLVMILIVGMAPDAHSGFQLGSTSESVESRHEAWRRQRLAKREEVHPYRPNRIERQFLRFDQAETPTLQEANFHGFYPRAAWIARGSGVAFGTRYWRHDIEGTPVDLAGAAFYSIHGYRHYDVQFGLVPHVGRKIPVPSWEGEELELADPERAVPSRLTLYATFRHRYLPQTDFIGLGPNSELDNRSRYLRKSTAMYVRGGYQLTDRISATLSAGYWVYSVGTGTGGGFPSTQELFDEETAPGISDAPDYLRYGANVLVDYRDEPGNPHRGFVLGATMLRSDARGAGAFSYDALWLDARAFLPLGSRQRVLAFRSAVVVQEPDSGNRVPFFVQPSLGGSHTLRGFDSYRFQGPKAMLYQLEYRWEAHPVWELALFTDAGTVSAPADELRFSRLNWDYGFGMRFKNFQSVLVRMDVAWSRETWRFFLRTSSSF